MQQSNINRGIKIHVNTSQNRLSNQYLINYNKFLIGLYVGGIDFSKVRFPKRFLRIPFQLRGNHFFLIGKVFRFKTLEELDEVDI